MELTLQEMEKQNRKATKALFEQIRNVPGVTIREYDDRINFEYNGHRYIFTAEFDE